MVGVVYGFAGLNFLFPFLYVVIGLRADPNLAFLMQGALMTIVPAAFCFSMMYAFLNLRRWGRWVGVVSNALLLLAIVGLVLQRFLAIADPVEASFPVLLFFVCLLAVPASLLAVCLVPSVRQVMTR